MSEARDVKLAVRIPVGFEMPGDSARMRKEGDRLVIEHGRCVARPLCRALVTNDTSEFSRASGLVIEDWLA